MREAFSPVIVRKRKRVLCERMTEWIGWGDGQIVALSGRSGVMLEFLRRGESTPYITIELGPVESRRFAAFMAHATRKGGDR